MLMEVNMTKRKFNQEEFVEWNDLERVKCEKGHCYTVSKTLIQKFGHRDDKGSGILLGSVGS